MVKLHSDCSVSPGAFRLAWCVLALMLGCQQQVVETPPAVVQEELPAQLSELGLFSGKMAAQTPAPGVLAYDLNTPLFSDYTHKYRFIKLPAGTSMLYRGDDDALQFPQGTIVAKTFAYPVDQRDLSKGQRLLETRIMRNDGESWTGVSYVWNQQQTEATQKLTGTVLPSEWMHTDGQTRSNAYIVPNANQCKGCHGLKNDPIGPRPRNLQRDFVQGPGPANQLERWVKEGVLKELNATHVTAALPRWNDEQAPLDGRARAWLDVNCAHCHQPTGPARQSGLDLRYTQQSGVDRGVMKLPVAAGRGSGGRAYDVVPGHPEKSILMFRLESTEPGIMMPELPRRMVDVEGVALIRDWIKSLRE